MFLKRVAIIIILLLALGLRLYGINWDQGWHLHPDERMLIMVADRINFFTNLNPDFFNYGTLPIYILKAVSQIIQPYTKFNVSGYDGLLGLGRIISTCFDLTTILIIYNIALSLFKRKQIALTSSLIYALAFFPIQNSHFFVVDVFLNAFVSATVLLSLLFINKPKPYYAPLLGLTVAAAITTKATGIILLPPVLSIIFIRPLIPYKHRHFLSSVLNIVLFGVFCIGGAYVFMPYAFNPYFSVGNLINYPSLPSLLNPKLIQDITLQIQMNSNPFIFPYTLQYVNTTPYIYYIKNIFLYGLGPFIFLLSLTGAGKIFLVKIYRDYKKTLSEAVKTPGKISQVLFILFYIYYFLLLGRSAVKFMRYMLPLYPAFAVMAGYGIWVLANKIPLAKRKKITVLCLGVISIWTLMFIRIYSTTHTRIAASEWIYNNIPNGSSLGVEHWDDRLPLPLGNFQTYQFIELPLYDPDSPAKWQDMQMRLAQIDYIIIASNRLYTPLQKLTDCKNLPEGRCYIQTADYYRKLLAGQYGFREIKEFSSYPGIKIGPYDLQFKDDNADESFTVYDHPKILIFKKI